MSNVPVIGRFAPSPSGPLHFGSLVTALASYCDIKSRDGRWLLRLEDVDTPRIIKDSEFQILKALEAYGFEWDGEIMHQQNQFHYYAQRLQYLIDQGYCYACECSRRSLREAGVSNGPMGQIYPANCRDRKLPTQNHSIRINTATAGCVGFIDRIYGAVELDITNQVGDFILKRTDGIYAYHLAVVLDDAEQGVTSILRGADLLESSCLHIFLRRCLGLPEPEYAHIPLAKNNRGQKLSKQAGATAIDLKNCTPVLISALEFLRQPIGPGLGDASPRQVIEQAVVNWNSELIKDCDQ